MSKSIPVSPKHGLNPCIPICFFCGKEKNEVALLGKLKNEVALLGKLKNDAEAPRTAILDYEPCDKCKEQMSKGITMVGVTPHPNVANQPEIAHGAYPTGNWLVVSEDFIKRTMPANKADAILKARRCLADDEVVTELSKQAK